MQLPWPTPVAHVATDSAIRRQPGFVVKQLPVCGVNEEHPCGFLRAGCHTMALNLHKQFVWKLCCCHYAWTAAQLLIFRERRDVLHDQLLKLRRVRTRHRADHCTALRRQHRERTEQWVASERARELPCIAGSGVCSSGPPPLWRMPQLRQSSTAQKGGER